MRKTLGELVREWREASGLTTSDLAKMVGGTVRRQHIEQLEAAGDRQPRYIKELARAMGSTVDDLLSLKPPPRLLPGAKRPTPRQPVSPDLLRAADLYSEIKSPDARAEALRVFEIMLLAAIQREQLQGDQSQTGTS